jgi:hypothetical protein
MGMRRNTTPASQIGYAQPLGPARLDLDDLKDLRLLLADRSKGPVRLYAGDRVAENGVEEDLQEDVPDDCLETVRFETEEPPVVVHLYRENARAWYVGQSSEGRELVDDVRRLVQTRRIRIAPIYRQAYMAGIVLGIAVVIFAIIAIMAPIPSELRGAWAYWIVMPVFMIAISLWGSTKVPSVVITLERRTDRRHVSRQFKRELVLVLVGAVAGFIAGVATDLLGAIGG